MKNPQRQDISEVVSGCDAESDQSSGDAFEDFLDFPENFPASADGYDLDLGDLD